MKGTMKRVKEIYQKIIEVTEEIGANHVGAYAAQSAYFFMLCMIPIILLLLTLVQYTPVTKADVDDCGNAGFPHLCGFHDGNHRQSGL